jgi:hypothetical protein
MDNDNDIDYDEDETYTYPEDAHDLVEEQNRDYEKCLQNDIVHAIAKQEAEDWQRIRVESWWEEKHRAAASVPPEPAADENTKNIVTLSLRFHTGQTPVQATRRFHRMTTTLRDVWNYAFAHEAVPPCTDVQLYTPMPRVLVVPSPEKYLCDTTWCPGHRYVRLHVEVTMPTTDEASD